MKFFLKILNPIQLTNFGESCKKFVPWKSFKTYVHNQLYKIECFFRFKKFEIP